MVCRSEKRFLIVTGKIKRTFIFEDLFEGTLNQIKKFFFLLLDYGVIYIARIFIDQNIFFLDLSYTVSYYLMARDLTAVRQEVNNLDSSVVMQVLEFAMNLALYGLS